LTPETKFSKLYYTSNFCKGVIMDKLDRERTKKLLEKVISAKEKKAFEITLALNTYEISLIYYLLMFLQDITQADELN